ncbi:MAG: LuxR C-terminal-related transcriptional regulator [Caldilineales bacterium]|nr:LuxR C-terminal-related transcriptional regulator [Caldilineales bacterium]
MFDMSLTNLPVQLTSFIGRVRETQEIERLLASARLVTLTGASGCGKTRLALQVASGMTNSFADGVWLVEFASLRDPALTANLAVHALGMQPLPEQPPLELLLGFVRTRRVLLVLDNCEHLIAACAELTRTLLSAAPDLTILATSREPLGLAGEMLYQVQPLSLPPGLDSDHEAHIQLPMLTPQSAGDYDAIHLFVERARTVLPGFALTAANTATVINICRRLDGIPLAIELASARVNVLTVEQIAERLDNRFAFLVSAQRTTPIPRHRTLREAIDWSYDLLTAEEQVLLRRLGVFAAGFTLDTVSGICGDDGIVPCDAEARTLELLSSLVHKSLVVARTLERTEARYRLLESIREYALEKMRQADEAARLRDRHSDLFLARAEEAAPRLGDAYQQLWLTWLEAEHDNLRAALSWSLESGRIESGLRIAIALPRFWEIRGHMPEAMSWLDRLLAAAGEDTPPATRARGHVFASFAAMLMGDAAACMSHAQAAFRLAERVGDDDRPLLALVLAAASTAERMAGNFQAAFELGERMIPMARQDGSSLYLGMSLLTQGLLAIEAGAYATARTLVDEGLALAYEDGDAFRIGGGLTLQGHLARCQEDYSQAKRAFESSVASLRTVGAERDLARALSNLGHACLHMGDADGALSVFEESLALHQAGQYKHGMAEALVGFAALAIVRGLPAAGAHLLGAAAASGRTLGIGLQPAACSEQDYYRMVARSRLGDAEFAAEEAAGRAMSLEQAIDYARRLPLEPKPTSAVRSKADGLTPREREVISLIAQGKSNDEIADTLVLSKRTVEKHISNIFSKLGFTQRAQIVRWVIEQGLVQGSN